jgi:hypothetical protein
MANRRLGVEYHIANFECKGTKDLPMPGTQAPTAAESENGVDEMRPDYALEANDAAVRGFIDQVTEDVVEAWQGGVGTGELEVDSSKVSLWYAECRCIVSRQVRDAVKVYWARIGVSPGRPLMSLHPLTARNDGTNNKLETEAKYTKTSWSDVNRTNIVGSNPSVS